MVKFHDIVIKLLICFCLLICSCLSNNSKNKKNDNWIINLKLISSSTPNPDKVVFRIKTDDKLRELLLTEKWDSIIYSGGLFDTLNFNKKITGIAEIDNPDELILGLSTGKLFMYTQNQMDSIASITFECVEINIFSKNETWKLKPCEKSNIKQ